jgi:hypothetical protein
MSTIFKKVVASIQSYEPQKAYRRGRPPKTINDIDRTKVDEVIYDQKLTDGLRSKTGNRSPERSGTDRQD